MNTYGRCFRVQIYGESHGKGVGVIIDGIPAGISISIQDFFDDLSKRKPNQFGTTPRVETDTPIFLSGIYNNFTTGAPVNIFFENKNIDSKMYSSFKIHPRPGHADFTATIKYKGYNDIRGGGHFSGRVTLGLIAAGVIAKKILSSVSITSEIDRIGDLNKQDFEKRLDSYILEIKQKGDSLGGIITTKIKNFPIGIGEPFFNSIESCISSIIFSIPGIKGIEFGAGFEGTKLLGSQFNDCIINSKGVTRTNNSGGINGGISNGNEIFFKVAVKPTSSILKKQHTFNFDTDKIEDLKIDGRHDTAFILRVPVIIECATAIALADLYLQNMIFNFNGGE